MTDDEDRLATAREQMEADLVKNRIEELHENPIGGNFDAEHLKTIHAYIFQDLPKHRPGVTRGDATETWIKHRGLEGAGGAYDVAYVSRGVAARIESILDNFGGVAAMKGLAWDQATERVAKLYGDLDHAHGFYEGNSRTLREFTCELAKEGGFHLDWAKAGATKEYRNALYLARDLAVLERTYPGLTPERAMQTHDRVEYEASFVIDALRAKVGERDLLAIVRENMDVEQ